MSQSILEMAKDLVLAQIEAGRIWPEDMQRALQQTCASLSALKVQEETAGVSGIDGARRAPTLVDWKKSITKHTITCLECGAVYKQLSSRHLRVHGMDAGGYRAKYGIPRTQPLTAKKTSALRKRIVAKIRPWEKTPRARKAQVIQE